ncbi:unnamed protein product, partial [marine sediment metagenome]
MKKSLIFITVISLLITLFIPNIAIAQEPCTVSVERGCAGEETTITGKVAGWKGVEGAIEVGIWLGIENIDTGWVYYFPITDTTQDPFSVSFSVNLVAGNYIAYMDSATWDGVSEFYDYYCDDYIEFVVVECPEPEPCYCSLLVQKRDEAGHPIDGAVFKVNGVEKTIRGGEARWDDLECDTTYEVRELKPEKKTERIHLGDCGERSTLRVVNKIEEEVVEEVVEEEVIIPEAGLDLNFTTLYAIAGLGILRILLG